MIQPINFLIGLGPSCVGVDKNKAHYFFSKIEVLKVLINLVDLIIYFQIKIIFGMIKIFLISISKIDYENPILMIVDPSCSSCRYASTIYILYR